MVAKTFHQFVSTPLGGRSRIVLLCLIVPLALSFLFPMWRIEMFAPQYPDGLRLDIYAYGLEAGNNGHDLAEVNILNHYIGMAEITREELRDLDWMPFALGGLALLALRCAVLGTVSSLIDLAVITAYITIIAFGRFAYMLYMFGSNLDPKAPIEVEPFMPVIIGAKQIANFTTYSYPLMASVLIGAFSLGVWLTMLANLVGGRKRAQTTAAAPAAA